VETTSSLARKGDSVMGGGDNKQKTKTNQTVKLPAWYEDAAKEALALGRNVAGQGYTPYIGPDIAAMDPGTQAGMGGFDAMSAAFGMPTGASASYMPEAQTYAGGVKGYSSFPAFEQAQEALKAKFPELYAYIQSFNKMGNSAPSNVSPIKSILAAKANPMQSAGSSGGLFDIAKLMTMMGGK
jgi:hypothetical protein